MEKKYWWESIIKTSDTDRKFLEAILAMPIYSEQDTQLQREE